MSAISSKFPQEDPDSNTGKTIASGSFDSFAAGLRGFGFIGILSILIILIAGNIFIHGIIFIPLGGLFVFLWRWRTQTSWPSIGFARPKNWANTILIGLAIGSGLKLILKSILMPLLGADPVNSTYHFLAENKSMLPIAILFMMVAGIAEETVFRGFLFERLSKLIQSGTWSNVLIVLITAVLFALGHLSDQGLTGFEQALAVGLVYGMIYTTTGNIWLLIFAHTAFDITAVILIYRKFETTVAQFFFR